MITMINIAHKAPRIILRLLFCNQDPYIAWEAWLEHVLDPPPPTKIENVYVSFVHWSREPKAM